MAAGFDKFVFFKHNPKLAALGPLAVLKVSKRRMKRLLWNIRKKIEKLSFYRFGRLATKTLREVALEAHWPTSVKGSNVTIVGSERGCKLLFTVCNG